jgi:phage terminase Nu1 subunit (DNA packaging protein)
VRQESNQRHPEVLNSWKEIAAYLDRGVRTVQRWECELGLPVRRPRQARRSAVIAFKSELDQWLSAIGTAALACETADPIAQLAALEQRLKQLQAETLIVEIKIKQINNGLSSVPENRSSDAGREAVA